MLHMALGRMKIYMRGNQAAMAFRIGYHHVKDNVETRHYFISRLYLNTDGQKDIRCTVTP